MKLRPASAGKRIGFGLQLGGERPRIGAARRRTGRTADNLVQLEYALLKLLRQFVVARRLAERLQFISEGGEELSRDSGLR